ncbi:phage tail tape measure protein [Streptococcus sp. Marseille-Q5986]|uniref:phage tail tape measure protein n=1 Tax=Streptococcus sp. Marseille-Q5986 TaxID=2972782 RepID=UPI002263F114|nr:phage tail tape measure protein [Streptococcus sp. Marseille-Q5986]
MASNIGELVATATLDVAPFQSSIQRLKTYIKGVDNSLKAMENNFKGAGKNVTNLKSLMDQTSSALGNYQKLWNAQSNRLNELKAQIGEVSEANDEQKKKLLNQSVAMSATAAKIAELKNRYEELAKSMRQVYIDDNAFTKFGKSAQELGNKFKNVGESVSGFGSALTKGVTAPIVAGAGIALKAAIDYESAFAGVKKTVDGTPQQFEKLSASIRNMAKEMPTSATEIAAVAEAAGQLGVPIGSIEGFTKTMINLGVSTNLSAEEAATSIAKIGNIMQVSGDDLDTWSAKFGAAVVGLGNNFATTESDIVNMANRLAASGKIAGLTTPEILGLSTAMSSVGIEAEAGGTAMTQTLTAISKAVSEGGNDLRLYAETAGTTADKFAEKWRTKPAEALQDFIRGLGKAKEQGKDTNKILDELGLTGIRQSNMLKSLGLAAETMGKAVGLANSEWEKGTALTDEANKRYETMQSKLQMLKNQLTDVAIEFGGPLLDALKDGLEAAKPWISTLADLAKQFSSMSREQQQNIIKWGLMAAAVGPAIKLLGGGISTIGGLIKVIGGLSRGIGILSGSLKYLKDLGGVANGLKAVAGSAGAVETAAAGAASNAGALSGAFGALANPIGLLVGGSALLAAGLVYLGNKKDEARIKTEEFGSQLSDTATKDLRDFQTKVDETSTAVANFGTHAGDAEKVSESFRRLHEEVAAGAEKASQRMEELAKKWGISDEAIANMKARNEQVVANTDAMANQVSEIYKRHNGDASKFSQEEKEIVLNNQKEMVKARIEMMKLSGEQQKAAIQALNGEISSLNETQLKRTKDVLKKTLDEENQLYKTSKDELKQLLGGKVIDQETYNKKLQTLETNHQQTMEALGTKYYQVMKAMDEEWKTRTRSNTGNNYWEEAKKVLEEYGLSYEVIGQKAAEASQKVGDSNSILANYTSEMSKEVKEANDAWSLLVGNINENGNFEVKSNVKEVIGEATQSAEGWAQLQFIAKNANLNSNARVTIAEALVESGKWKDMTLEEKQVIVKNQAGLQAIFDSEENLKIWNSMPAEVKQLLLDKTDVMNNVEIASQILKNYDAQTPKIKELLANDKNFRDAVSRSAETLKTWDATTPFPKDLKLNPENVLNNGKLSIDKIMEWNLAKADNKVLNATDNTGGAVASAQASVNSPTQTSPISINATDDTGGASQSASASVNAPYQLSPIGINALDLTGNPSSTASAGVNAVKQNFPIDINATNKTQGEANAASNAVNAVKQNDPININAKNQTGGVISSVWASLSSLPSIKFIDVVTRFFTQKHAKGTDNHPGGLAMVNDQRGTLYKELVTLPDGTSFIPQGRNVTLPLPPGTKVMRAGKTRSLMNRLGIPNYEKGIGFEDTKISHLTRRFQEINTRNRIYNYSKSSSSTSNFDNHSDSNSGQAIVTELVSLKASVEDLLGKLLDKDSNTYLDGQVIAENSYRYQGNIMRREGI